MTHQVGKDRRTCHDSLTSMRKVHHCGFWHTNHTACEGEKPRMMYPNQAIGRSSSNRKTLLKRTFLQFLQTTNGKAHCHRCKGFSKAIWVESQPCTHLDHPYPVYPSIYTKTPVVFVRNNHNSGLITPTLLQKHLWCLSKITISRPRGIYEKP